MSALSVLNTDFTEELTRRNIRGLDINAYYKTIAQRNKLSKVRNCADYQSIQDLIYDMTMSCSCDECVRWLRYFMVNAIGYGYKTLNKDWILYFLAAWDIHKEVNK